MVQRGQTEQMFSKLKEVLPGGVNSPARSFPHLGMTPMVAKEGKGDTIVDVDGNRYIDFGMSWGALILGHAHPYVVDATIEYVKRGSSFGVTTEIEMKIAKKITEIIPCVEKLRFVNSGTEAVMTAIRLARGFTGRSKIVKFEGNYHGHVDSLLLKGGSYLRSMNSEASSRGVPQGVIDDTIILPFNNLEVLERFFSEYPVEEVACVAIEAIAGNMGVVPADHAYMKRLRELTEEHGVLLLIDEVITGFRVGLRGACEYFDVTPDLVTYGKIVGGGFPVAALGGSAEIMDFLAPNGEVFQAGTLSGNPVGMAAGFAALEKISQPGFYEELNKKADRFLLPIQEKMRGGCIQRVGSMFTFFFGVDEVKTSDDLVKIDQEKFKAFYHHLFKHGVYLPPSPFESSFVSMAHTEHHLKQAQEVIIDFL
ncbi:MAG: glutamate-1-semialdehyde 2,1-aminomutase [Simkaniaceae bacterium]|nr:glutamate-1-semialdehyde 2,1-aminomutase [Simkaniaceae bacterium]